MEEKIIVKSERYDVGKIFKIIVIIGAILSITYLAYIILGEMNSYDRDYQEYIEHQQNPEDCYKNCFTCKIVREHPTKMEYVYYFTVIDSNHLQTCFLVMGTFLIIGVLIYLWLRGYELTVTDKRIYGTVAWGKRVDLPVDSISATATINLFKGVSVSTASGKISFLVIKNAEEIYNIMNKLIIERQQKERSPAPIVSVSATDETDKLKKYKDLLDSGVITQEEFDAKKKQLLGL